MKKILVYLGATMPADASYTEAVRQLGESLARHRMPLVFGGSREGTMSILADAVLHNGGEVIGVFTKALPPEFLYQGMTQTLITETISERKAKMFALADAIIAMPGSFGTWDELFEALEVAKVEAMHHRPVKPVAILNLNGYYDGVLQLLQRSVQEGYTKPRYAKLLASARTMPELLDWLKRLDDN